MMNQNDSDSMFEEKSNRWVWFLPSVLLHVVIGLVWVSMPKEPPRKPASRKMIIKSEQAEKLQEHLTEANLRELKQELGELQAIKQAMAKIRAHKMKEMESFEAKMTVDAPQSAHELFLQILEIEAKLNLSLKTVDELLFQEKEIYIVYEKLIQEEQWQKALTPGIELHQLRTNVTKNINAIKHHLGQFYGLLSNAQTHTEWVSEGNVVQQMVELIQNVQKTLTQVVNFQQGFKDHYTREQNYFDKKVTEKRERVDKVMTEYDKDMVEGPKLVADQRKALQAKIDDLNEKKKIQEEDVKAKKVALDQVTKDLASFKKKKAKDDVEKKENDMTIKKLSKEYNELKIALKASSSSLSALGKSLSNDSRDLNRIKDFKISSRLVSERNDVIKNLKYLVQGLPDIGGLKPIILSHEANVKQSKEILKTLTQVLAATTHDKGVTP